MQISRTAGWAWVTFSTSITYVPPPPPAHTHICTTPLLLLRPKSPITHYRNTTMQPLTRAKANFAIGEIMCTTWIIRACEIRIHVCRFVPRVMWCCMVCGFAGYGFEGNRCTPPLVFSASYNKKHKRKFDAWTARVSASWCWPTTQIGSPTKLSWYVTNMCMACACVYAHKHKLQIVNAEKAFCRHTQCTKSPGYHLLHMRTCTRSIFTAHAIFTIRWNRKIKLTTSQPRPKSRLLHFVP